MSKKKIGIILVVLLLVLSNILLLVNRVKLSNENDSLKDMQGTIIQDNIVNISGTVYDARNDLYSSNISKLHRYYWQFNEFTKLHVPLSISLYSINIRNDYGELIKLSESNSSQEEINKINNDLEFRLSRFQTALSLIMKKCLATNHVKFYSLNSEDRTNLIMKNVLNILTEDDNGSKTK